MHNYSFKKSLSVAKTEYIKWALNPRMIIVFVLLIFIKTCAIDTLVEHSVEMNSPLNILEPFIAIGNSGVLVLIIPAVFLTLISDFPRTDGNTLFFILRAGKLNWLIGQIVFAIMSIASFLAVVFLGSVVPLLDKMFWGNGWSLVITKYDIMFPEKAGGFASQLVPPNLYNQLSPFSATIQTYILLSFYLFILALIMLLFNVVKHKIMGFFIAGSVIAFGVAGCGIKAVAMWLFPMANAIIWLHYTEYYRKPIKPISYSYIYFAVVIFILVILNLFAIKKFTLETVSEVD